MTTIETRGRIPISQPSITEADLHAVAAVVRSGMLAQGPVVEAFEAAFARYIDVDFAVAASSGTTALHLALLAHGVGPGDEVITTPFSFIATANAIRYAGARPVFADIDPATLNIDPASIAARITRRTKAILVVHLYGHPCDLSAIQAMCDRHGLALIEDACQAHGATYEGRRVGSFGTGCFSFYATKNMACGEGGMITTSDPEIADRARLLRGHGMRIRYLHEQLGFNFRMTDIHAAIGLSQLDRLDAMNACRIDNAAYFDAAFAGIDRPAIPPNTRSVWHQYTILVEPGRRDSLVSWLDNRGIGTGVFYPLPIHRQPAYLAVGLGGDCPHADAAADRVLSLPVHPGVGVLERERIVEEVRHGLERS